TGGPLTLFAQQLPIATPINLLQGPYAIAKSSGAGWQAWRVAAILLVALVGLHVVGKAAELSILKKSERTLDSSIGETFRMAMPGEQNATDARRRMEQRLISVRGGGAGGGLLSALAALSQAHGSAPGTVVKAMSFRQGAVELKIAAPDAASLDHLSQTLRSNGWDAELTSGNNVGAGYEGRIQIRPH
ncbi:MAG TPA: type II secretion system protein GspL, partial [Steroidobacteraceae bacterium]|nr:type II secretion system protein GspL [Steroidobacteraceae bacterium]